MFRLIGRFAGKYTVRICINVILVFMQMIVQVYLLAHEMKKIIDNGVAESNMDFILKSGGKMILFSILTGILALACSYASSTITAGFTCDIREACFDKSIKLSPQDFVKFGESTLLTRSVNDAAQFQALILNFMRNALTVPIVIIILLFSIFGINKIIFLVVLVSFSFTSVFLTIFGKRSKPWFDKLQKQQDRINLLVKEKITGVRTIRSFGNQKFEEEKLEKVNQDAFDMAIDANKRINFLSPVAMIIMNWTVVLVYYIGNGQLKSNLASISDLILIFQYLTYFMTVLAIIPFLLNLLPKVVVASERINELLDYEPEQSYSGKTAPHSSKGEIEFKNVSFGYGSGTQTVSDISFIAKSGKTTALIGATGSGKTTIMNLLMGFFVPDKGQVFFDGQPYQDLDMDILKTYFSYASQGALVFQDSAYNNITMYQDGISKERIEKACHASCFDEVIDLMPDGINTIMAQGGRNISGGQRQRLSLARTVAKEASVYIFDDTFSALDAITEQRSRNQINEMLKDKTIIMVAQKINTIKNADQIIVLDNGRIAAKGTHRELLASCLQYQEIYKTQCYLEGEEA